MINNWISFVRATVSNKIVTKSSRYFNQCRIKSLLSRNLHRHTVQLSNHQANTASKELVTPSDPELLYAKVSGTQCGQPAIHQFKVSYTDENITSPIVALAIHGCPGNHLDFRYLASQLAPSGMRIIRLNMPGFGASEKPSEFVYTAKNMAQFVVAFLDHIGVKKVDVGIGTSFGCAIITSLSIVQPDLILSYAFLSGVGGRPHAGLRPFLITRLIGYLLNTTPTIEAATTAALRYLFQYSGFNVKKLTDNEMVNTLRICCIADFQLHNQNLQRISERKIPVLMAYCITDRLIEHQIFNENCQALRLKTIDEIASLNNRQANRNPFIMNDTMTGPIRQILFKKGGHYIHKIQAKYIGEAILQMLDNNANT